MVVAEHLNETESAVVAVRIDHKKAAVPEVRMKARYHRTVLVVVAAAVGSKDLLLLLLPPSSSSEHHNLLAAAVVDCSRCCLLLLEPKREEKKSFLVVVVVVEAQRHTLGRHCTSLNWGEQKMLHRTVRHQQDAVVAVRSTRSDLQSTF